MYKLIKTALVNSIALAMLLLGISACDHKSIAILPEHITLEELNEELTKELGHSLPANNALEIRNSQEGLILTGDPALIAKAISIAQQLDKPHNYYLEVRNTPINSISTHTETMRILLHPENPVRLGHITLIDGPWQELIKDEERFLQLELDSSLILTIDIKSQQDRQVGFYSGKHPMQLNEWIIAFNESEMSQGKKIITSRPKKQLWLRLTKANSQSEINLR